MAIYQGIMSAIDSNGRGTRTHAKSSHPQDRCALRGWCRGSVNRRGCLTTIYTLVSKQLYGGISPVEYNSIHRQHYHLCRKCTECLKNISTHRSITAAIRFQCCAPLSCFIGSRCSGFPSLLVARNGQY